MFTCFLKSVGWWLHGSALPYHEGYNVDRRTTDPFEDPSVLALARTSSATTSLFYAARLRVRGTIRCMTLSGIRYMDAPPLAAR